MLKIALSLLACGLTLQPCVAQIVAKPIPNLHYSPKMPKVIHTARPAGDQVNAQGSASLAQQKLARQKMRGQKAKQKLNSIQAGKMWNQRLANRFSQASQAGAASTLLH